MNTLFRIEKQASLTLLASFTAWQIALLIILLMAFVFLIWLILEPLFLNIKEEELEPADSTVQDGGESTALSADTLRVTFFSDYHAGTRRSPFSKILEAVSRQDTDIVIFGGDLSNGEKDKAKGLHEMRQIADAVQKSVGLPVFGVWGNHDHSLTGDEAEQAGLLLLNNEAILVRSIDGKDWLIAGEMDIRSGTPDARKAFLTPSERWIQSLVDDEQGRSVDELRIYWKKRFADIPTSRRIVVGHNPDQILALDETVCSYFLSGHFHGGQIRLPFRMEYILLREEQLIKMGIFSGAFELQGIRGFITKGVGCVLFPFRFLARPEINLLRLKEAKDHNESVE